MNPRDASPTTVRPEESASGYILRKTVSANPERPMPTVELSRIKQDYNSVPPSLVIAQRSATITVLYSDACPGPGKIVYPSLEA
jgi:hypothetical protein